MALPTDWNRSRAAAAGATLVLHAVAILWLLALRFEIPARLAGQLEEIFWQELPVVAPASPTPESPERRESARPEAAPAAPPAPISAPPRVSPLPIPDEEGWSNIAKDAGRRFSSPPSYRRFGEVPEGPPTQPREQYPPSIWPKPLPRVGETVVTPEGETIIWVSDYCYVSVGSRSLTQKDIHAARNGVRTCILAQFGGEKEVRDDLFDSIKRPPPPQEPGCNAEGIGLSCSR
jgi:hypothetical protein